MPEENNNKTVKEQLDGQKEEEKEEVVTEEEGGKVNALAFLSYLGIFCLIPLLTEKEDDFVQYHAKQGFVLFLAELATMIFLRIPVLGWILAPILTLVWLVFSVIGIINVMNGRRKEIPLIGQYSKNFKF